MHSPSRIAPTGRSSRWPLSPGLLLPAVLSVAALIAGCGGSSSSSTTKALASTTHAAKSTPASTAAAKSTPASTAAASGLPGAWSGQYSGAFTGTFHLNWTQSGSKLSGTITLSDPPETTGITGSVSGGSIKFGTVSGAVYSGTISGSSMSGNYVTPKGGGSWNANKA